MANTFIAFQTNEETRCIVEAILEDNPGAIVDIQPAMVKLDVPTRLVIKRASVEDKLGRDFDLQELQLHLITMSGYVEETEEEFTLSWNA